MIFLAVLAILHLPSTKSFRPHLSEILELKCNALPYRTTYIADRCYFAVLEEVDYIDASDECSSIFAGSKATTNAPAHVFEAMMADKSKFHGGRRPSGKKNIMCYYDNDYKCDAAETMLSAGRCLVRAPKKMNFVEVLSGLTTHSFARMDSSGNKAKFMRDGIHVMDQTDLTPYRKDVATVVDKAGYFSNGGTEHLMDVVCVKNAGNNFTKGAEQCKSYHEDKHGEKLQPAENGIVNAKTCYASSSVSTRYEILGRATVETQRGCEVLCDSRSACSAFSFKDAGFASSCVLLSTPTTSSQTCSAPTTIFLKKTTGCVARTNFTAEFGVDPCIDESAPSAFRGFGATPICTMDKNRLYVVRAVDVNGRRITLDNEGYNWVEKRGDMWVYIFPHGKPPTVVPIVAFTCALAGGAKCPCKHLAHLTDISDKPNYPAVPERVNPCASTSSYLWFNLTKNPTWGPTLNGLGWLTQADTARSFVTCKAGMWILWHDKFFSNWGVQSASCYR